MASNLGMASPCPMTATPSCKTDLLLLFEFLTSWEGCFIDTSYFQRFQTKSGCKAPQGHRSGGKYGESDDSGQPPPKPNSGQLTDSEESTVYSRANPQQALELQK